MKEKKLNWRMIDMFESTSTILAFPFLLTCRKMTRAMLWALALVSAVAVVRGGEHCCSYSDRKIVLEQWEHVFSAHNGGRVKPVVGRAVFQR